LAALARSSPDTWRQIRFDPAGVLLVLRAVRHDDAGVEFRPAVHDPAVLEQAATMVHACPVPFVDWGASTRSDLYRSCLQLARVCEFVAEQTKLVHADCAWIAGLLAPLGWIGVAALSTGQLSHPPTNGQAHATDHETLARRLNNRWRLPSWLAAVTGHLSLPAKHAEALGAHGPLFRTVQLVVEVIRGLRADIGLEVGTRLAENAAALGLGPDKVNALTALAQKIADLPGPIDTWQSPYDAPLLSDLLALAVENHRRVDAPLVKDLERDVDQLQAALRQQCVTEDARLRTRNLEALAELAAGAGHEINNPLAVISGQAQYLLNQEWNDKNRRALETIVRQTQRIHQILTALSQFARPSRPKKQTLDLSQVARRVVTEFADLAAQRGVRVISAIPESSVESTADAKQLHLALSCLLKNAIEAAPKDGWAGMRLETPAPDRAEFVVEDNGGGFSDHHREQLFDPFFSGRQAGRGRGLGLPTAWRLAREHGGDVRVEEMPGGLTRFVLSIPVSEHGVSSANGQNGQH
jgi:signal transduction histidine kinase